MTTNERVEAIVKSMVTDPDGAVLDFITNTVLTVLDAIEAPVVPQISDRCIFWDEEELSYTVGILASISNEYTETEYISERGEPYKNCRLLIKDAE